MVETPTVKKTHQLLPPEQLKPKFYIENLDLWFSDAHILKDITCNLPEKHVTAVMGPSGCGKSTFLRVLNRMHDLNPDCKITGSVKLEQTNIFSPEVDINDLRKDVGMVFQRPNPFPKSIFENVAYGLRIHGERNHKILEQRVEDALRDANLWDEVKDKLQQSAFELSGGQQQRLCIARALAIKPDVLLLDEPASALDPISTARLEELIEELEGRYTVVIVTHNLQQAARVSQYTAFLMLGELVEFGITDEIFTAPSDERTENYLRGIFG
ncbi:MAG: phosphate ABC transporter ATP-binding protein [Candidatus Coatesbacteria bacterium]|jgi:phosphate transport system ATP-binding protein|nr:phosphate ABC transporter ATP-binding protein [Candidatus Coatesbacteria bacterium]